MPNVTSIIVRDFVVNALIGIYPQEHVAPQKIKVNVTMDLYAAPLSQSDNIEDTVSYEGIVDEIRAQATTHHNLVETLAEILATYVLQDQRVAQVHVEILKCEVFKEGAVGCSITRTRSIN